jgi:hypothetical protein
MQKDKKKVQLSEIRKAEKRIFEIQRHMRSLPREKLEKKIFAGHWRFLKVRADVLRSSIGEQAARVVEACNTYCLGKKKDPNSYKTSTETCYPINGSILNGSSFHQEGQGLRPLYHKEFEKSGFPEHFERKWFNKQAITKSIGSKNLVHYKYFPKVPKHMLEFDYKPAYITEVNIKAGDLESELAKLYKFMNANNGWNKLHGNHKDEWDLSLDKKKSLNKLSEKELRQELQDI